MTTKTGYEKAKEVADKLKAENLEAAAKEEEGRKNALAELGIAGLQIDADIAAQFKATAEMGTENISGAELPLLKVTEHGSKKNILTNGKKATDGSFYYSPTKEAFDGVMVSIVAASRGFYTAKYEADGKTLKANPNSGDYGWFNQLVGGVILANNMPFVMFASGSRWPKFNEFCKVIKPFTKNRETPVPMYAFKVQLSTELKENGVGKSDSYIVNYNIAKNDAGQIMLISDKTQLKSLPKLVDEFNKMFDSFIAKVEVDRATGKPLNGQSVAAVVPESEDPTLHGVNPTKSVAEGEIINTEDIPF